MGPTTQSDSLWSIVLAGGEGTRMCPFIRQWLGEDRPKQYCSFFGSETLLGQTVDRLTRLVERRRIVTVIGRGHRAFLEKEDLPGTVIEQPCRRGTGPGVFLPASFIFAQDPDATVVISPSDHFISPETAFAERIREAVELLEEHPDRLILIGAVPSGPEQEYGWIEPDNCAPFCRFAPVPPGLRHVRSFREKPDPAEATHCFNCGYYWNTMIVVARLRALWAEARRRRPRTMRRFETLRNFLELVQKGYVSEALADNALARLYETLPSFDLCGDLFTRAASRCLLFPLQHVFWDDLGRPERLLEVMDHADQPPNFPASVAKAFARPHPLALVH